MTMPSLLDSFDTVSHSEQLLLRLETPTAGRCASGSGKPVGGLLLLVGKRNRLLKYMASSNREGYLSLIKRLGLRK